MTDADAFGTGSPGSPCQRICLTGSDRIRVFPTESRSSLPTGPLDLWWSEKAAESRPAGPVNLQEKQNLHNPNLLEQSL